MSQLGQLSVSVLEREGAAKNHFLEVKGALNMCPLEGAPRSLQSPGLFGHFLPG